MATFRICFFGDSILHGTKDPAVLGWPGRLCAEAIAAGNDITMYNLGVRGDTSEGIRQRWRDEAARRISSETGGLLVFAFGLNDTLVDENGIWRVEPARTIENVTAIVREAAAWLPTIFVGPAPVDDTRPPPRGVDGRRWSTANDRIRSVAVSLERIAAATDVPYLDMFEPLERDPRWTAALAVSDSIHPPDGYPVIAELVGGWAAWRRLLMAGTDVPAAGAAG